MQRSAGLLLIFSLITLFSISIPSFSCFPKEPQEAAFSFFFFPGVYIVMLAHLVATTNV
jgi:hypothetical protein